MNETTSEPTTPPTPPPAQPRYRGRDRHGRMPDPRAHYRAVNRFAVISVVLGALSILTMFGWLFGVLPLAGIVLGILALRQIDAAPGEMTGRSFAIAGLVLSPTLWVLGMGYVLFVAINEVPVGYTVLTFEDLQPDPENPGELIPQKILDLEDKPVYIKGYMYPGRQNTGIQQFVLVPSLFHCQFCQRDLKSTEMVQVATVGDLLADSTSNKTGVGGKLYIDRQEAVRPLGGLPYKIEADYLRQ
ncbi:MAG: DUF4190 domain-containing protein [Planctomycetia bacterium]|nr:DUF4190 domain-containing protein [Planctomycetia bacterium]